MEKNKEREKVNETKKMNETNESATIQKLGEDFVVVIPNDICEKLDIKEDSNVIIEPFLCGGDAGIRIKLKA